MHVLVAGGAGFIGSNYVRYVLEHTNHEVTTLDALTYAGSKANLNGVLDHDRHRFVEGDIRDEALIDDLAADVEAVVNFAAESHVDRSIDGAEPFVSTNVQGVQVLLDAALVHDHDRFVQISTDEVYGQILEGMFTEDDPLNPRNPYAATKASADLLSKSYHTTHDLPVVITRSSNNFGPRQHTEKLIPKLIERADAGQSLPLYGDGKHVREWLYVGDHCRAIQTVLERGDPGEVYNIGSGIELTNLEIAQRIVDAVGASEEQIEFVDDRPGHDRRYALDTSKITELGWASEIDFDEGLARTIEYYLS
jgi:dTDP-glucose 4,6-dehydratase